MRTEQVWQMWEGAPDQIPGCMQWGSTGELSSRTKSLAHGAELASWNAYSCFQVWPPALGMSAQTRVQALHSPALEDAPATQRVLGLEAASAVRELGAGCHGYLVHLDGQQGQRQWVRGLRPRAPSPWDSPHLLGSQNIEVAATAVYQQVRADG